MPWSTRHALVLLCPLVPQPAAPNNMAVANKAQMDLSVPVQRIMKTPYTDILFFEATL
jgi:hypothetical protein